MLTKFKDEYEKSAAANLVAKTFHAQLKAKADSLSEIISGLVNEVAGRKRAEEAALSRYVAGEIGEAELSESRSEVKHAELKLAERQSLLDALGSEIEKAQDALKSTAADERRARDIFWQQASQAGKASVRAASLTAIKKAYLVTRLTFSAGYTPSLSAFIEDVFSTIPLPDSEQESLQKDLVREYGVPLY
jgi:chromosome segregation ATPase